MYQKDYHIYFAGIGGIGMSGIAELLLKQGYRVSGSDLNSTPITKRLQELGAVIHKGHQESNLDSPDLLVKTSAIGEENPEIKRAKQLGIPVIKRAEMLAEIIRPMYAVAVSGAHGKTTTTALTASVLAENRMDPTVACGGIMNHLGTNAVSGSGKFVVVEADESDGSFLHFNPAIAIVTNIDLEHLDFYSGLDEIKEIFVRFLSRIPFYGAAVLCTDNPHVQAILPDIGCRKITYGIKEAADLTSREIDFNGSTSSFSVVFKNQDLGRVTLNLPGIHNIYNALAAVAAGLELGIGFPVIASALGKVSGVKRRLELKGEALGITVMDDYGHHPTEISTTLAAARKSWPDKRLVTVFQPHRYTRTASLLDEFSESFENTDLLFVLPIYAASETNTTGVDSETLVEKTQRNCSGKVAYAESHRACIEKLKESLKPGDMVLTMGAGDVWKAGETLLHELAQEKGITSGHE